MSSVDSSSLWLQRCDGTQFDVLSSNLWGPAPWTSVPDSLCILLSDLAYPRGMIATLSKVMNHSEVFNCRLSADHYALMCAIHLGLEPLVSRLLHISSLDLSAYRQGPLMLAALSGHTSIISLLLSQPQVDIKGRKGEAAVFFAQSGQLAFLQKLVALGAEADVKNRALISAATAGQAEVVEWLVKVPGVDLGSDRHAAFAQAAFHGHVEVVDRLLRAGVEATVNEGEALNQAARNGHLQVVRRLLDEPCAASLPLNDALIHAATTGQLDVVNELLSRPGIEACANDNWAVTNALSHGYLEVAKRLLAEAGVLPTGWQHRGLIEAARAGHTRVVDTLLTHYGSHFDVPLLTDVVLKQAAREGQLAVVERLMQSPDIRPNNSTLICAVFSGNVSLVQFLLSHPDLHLDITAQQHEAFLGAAVDNLVPMVKYLLTLPQVDATAQHNAALIRACQAASFEMVELLLAAPGVDAGDQNNQAVAWAARNSDSRILQRLLKEPAVDPAANANRALLWAVRANHVGHVRLLMEHPNVDASAPENEAIQQAIHNENVTMVQQLLQCPRVARSMCGISQWPSQAARDEAAVRLCAARMRSRWLKPAHELVFRLISTHDVPMFLLENVVSHLIEAPVARQLFAAHIELRQSVEQLKRFGMKVVRKPVVVVDDDDGFSLF